MPLLVPNAAELKALELILQTETLSLRLYSNNYTPTETTTTANFTEVAGGGYARISLDPGDWILTSGDPTFGVYAQRTFSFTGPTNAPGTVYGYYVVDSVERTLWAERFAPAVLPFSPIAGSSIRITPRFEAS